MILSTKLAAKADDLLGRYGQIVTITRSDIELDPVTNIPISTETNVSGQFKAVNPPAAQGMIDSFENSVASEASVLYKKIRYLIVSAYQASFEPKAGDKLTMQGVDYTVWGVTPVSPSGTDIVYRIGIGV
jgi:hypothetical protein